MSEPAPRPRPAEAGAGGSLRIGRILGIPIRIHFTFLLLLVWFGASSAGGGRGFLSGVVWLVLLFGCVVLHELGHAAMARRFGVETREIVLYPIGGVARVDRMPSGLAELQIALAGPAVNFGLAILLAIAAKTQGLSVLLLSPDFWASGPILVRLFWVNVIMLVFNLLPAFPMDGGRVLRALLTLVTNENRATQIAARVGQGAAMILAVIALLSNPIQPVLLLIAFFVFVGAGQEAMFQRNRAAVAGLTARAAMISRFETLAPQDSLGRAAELLLATSQQDFPVIDAWKRVVGVLPRSILLAGLARQGREQPVLEVMDREPRVVAPELPLEEVLRLLQSNPTAPLLVVEGDGLVGMITLENFGELVEVSARLRAGATSPSSR